MPVMPRNDAMDKNLRYFTREMFNTPRTLLDCSQANSLKDVELEDQLKGTKCKADEGSPSLIFWKVTSSITGLLGVRRAHFPPMNVTKLN